MNFTNLYLPKLFNWVAQLQMSTPQNSTFLPPGQDCCCACRRGGEILIQLH